MRTGFVPHPAADLSGLDRPSVRRNVSRFAPLPGCVMVAQGTLNPLVMVRIHAGQPFDSGLALLGLRSWRATRREVGVECPEQRPQACVEGPSTQTLSSTMMDNDQPVINPPEPIPGGTFVYILACAQGALSVGSARDVSRRMVLHRTGRGTKFTNDHAHARLVYVEGPFDLKTAIRRERQLKCWSRAKKLALIAGDRRRLKELSRSHD